MIDVSAVTTEFNTLFETVTAIAEQVDPIKLNQTLTATAEALTGLGDGSASRWSTATHPRGSQRRGCRRSATTPGGWPTSADVYADASPDLWDGLEQRGDRPHARSTTSAATSTRR